MRNFDNVPQIVNQNLSVNIQPRGQNLGITQIGDENQATVNLTGINTAINLEQNGNLNSFDLTIQNGNNNRINADQRNDLNTMDLFFGNANNLNLMLEQDGGDYLKIDIQDTDNAVIPSAIRQTAGGGAPPALIITDVINN